MLCKHNGRMDNRPVRSHNHISEQMREAQTMASNANQTTTQPNTTISYEIKTMLGCLFARLLSAFRASAGRRRQTVVARIHRKLYDVRIHLKIFCKQCVINRRTCYTTGNHLSQKYRRRRITSPFMVVDVETSLYSDMFRWNIYIWFRDVPESGTVHRIYQEVRNLRDSMRIPWKKVSWP